MKVSAAVPTHNLELPVDSFDNVGCRKGFPHVLGVFQEGQVVLPFLAQFRDPGGIDFGKAIAEFLELMVSELQVPAGLNRLPALLKLNAIGLRQVRGGITLHMNDTKLDIGIGKETRSNGQQATEVIMNDNHQAA